MRFFAIIALVGLCLSAPVAAAQSPQPTAQNGTDSPTNRTAAPSTATPAPTGAPPAAQLRNGSVPNVTVDVTLPNRSRSTPAPTATPDPVREVDVANGSDAVRIDSSTVIVSSEYHSDRGMTEVILRSEDPQTVTISDAGYFSRGGEVPRRTVRMDPRETVRVMIPALEVDGDVGVSISTEETLYAHYVQRGDGGGLAILRAVSTLQAWGGGIVIAFTWMVIGGISVLRREDGSPEVAT